MKMSSFARLSSSLVLVLPAFVVDATMDVKKIFEPSTSILSLPTMTTNNIYDRKLSHVRKLQDLSPECEAEYNTLLQNQALTAAATNRSQEFEKVDPTTYCNIDSHGEAAYCNFDLRTLPSHENYVAACASADGELEDFYFGMVCSDSQIEGLAIFIADDICVPTNCTGTEDKAIVKGVEQELLSEYEGGLTGSGGSCIEADSQTILLAEVAGLEVWAIILICVLVICCVCCCCALVFNKK